MENPKPIKDSEKKKPHLSSFGIIKSAIEIPLSSSTFFFFTVLTSLPPLCISLLQKSIPFSLQKSSYLATSHNLIQDAAIFLDFIFWIINTWLFNFFRFLAPITTVQSVSYIYSTGIRSVSVRNLVSQYAIPKANWIGPITTFLYMSVFSTISFEAASLWRREGPLVQARTDFFYYVVHGITCAVILAIWCYYCVLWNLGVVCSILEGDREGMEAFSASADLMKGSKTRGTILMVVDMIWRFGSGLIPWVSWLERWGFTGTGLVVMHKVLDSSLFWIARVMNWVVLVIYYHDCKNRQSLNKSKII